MKAITFYRYGPLDNIKLEDVEKPVPSDNEVLLKIYASSVIFGNLAHIKGIPFLARLWTGFLRPKHTIPGGDVAGCIESVGKSVKNFKPGDDVFGDLADCGFGAYAEYVAIPENKIVLKPTNVSYNEAAASAQASVVALQGLKKGKIRNGQKVLIYGASGGIGTYAVQIAKSYGAEVTAVCGTRNIEKVRSIGADYIIDYTQEDFTKQQQYFDLILSTAGFCPISKYKKALSPQGIYVTTGGSLKQIFQAMLFGPLMSVLGTRKFYNLLHKINNEDLNYIKELFEKGKLKTVIDNQYQLSETVVALKQYEKGHTCGKIIITI